MKQAKQKVISDARVRVRAFDVFQRAVEEGIAYGWQRAHKHTDTPSEEDVKESIEAGVLNAVGEYFEFEEEVS